MYTRYNFYRELDINLTLPPEFICTAHNILRNNANGKIIECGQISTMSYYCADYIVSEYARKRKLKFHDLRKKEYAKKLCKCKPDLGLASEAWSAPGVFILPHGKEITDYTPVEYLSDIQNDHTQEVTHFDYHALYDNLLKMMMCRKL